MDLVSGAEVKLLVTGGCGFIGSHLVDALAKEKHEIHVLDNCSSDHHDHPYYLQSKYVTYHANNIIDPGTKSLYQNVDVVFHLAAESRIPSCLDNPVKATITNVLGTTMVLQYAREHKVRRVIYSSTSSCYGNNDAPQVESMPPDCLNPYSQTKQAGEGACKLYTKLFGLETVIFRYFNVYGPREPLRGPYAPVVGKFLRQFKDGHFLSIVAPGTQRRDFVHVQDIVQANLLALTTTLSSELYGQIYNIGSGVNYSVKELAEMISPTHELVPERPGEATETLANLDRATAVFGFRPTIQLADYIREQKGS